MKHKITPQNFTQKEVEATSRFYNKIHITYEKLGVFSEDEHSHTTNFGLPQDRIANQKLQESIRDGVVLNAGGSGRFLYLSRLTASIIK